MSSQPSRRSLKVSIFIVSIILVVPFYDFHIVEYFKRFKCSNAEIGTVISTQDCPSARNYHYTASYSYTVDATDYIGSQIIRPSFWQVNKKFHTNDTITIYYNPSNQSESMIELNSDYFGDLVFCVALIALLYKLVTYKEEEEI